MRRFGLLVSTLCLVAVVFVPVTGVAGVGTVGCDFDGDGAADLAVGVPGESIGVQQDAGAVNVLYGKVGVGLTSRDQMWHQDRPGIPGKAREGDGEVGAQSFGDAVACGDFNGDGFSDLAIGVPTEDVSSSSGVKISAGAMNVIYGSGSGLSSAGAQIWHEGSAGVPGSVGYAHHFGSNLAVGDFDGDGHDDVAVNTRLFFGSPQGLAAGLNVGSAEFRGDLTAAGDFDGDGFDDLVATSQSWTWGSSSEIEDVPTEGFSVMYGGDRSSLGDRIVVHSRPHQLNPVPGLQCSPSPGLQPLPLPDLRAVAAGDVNKDGFDDVAMAVSWRDYEQGGCSGYNGLNVLVVAFGSNSGLEQDTDTWQFLDPAVVEIPDLTNRAPLGGVQGMALSDFNGDGYDDALIGLPHANRDYYGGAVLVAGSPDGLVAGSGKFVSQDTPGVHGSDESWDEMGQTVGADDFDGDGYTDAVIGTPYEGIGSVAGGGMINIIYGSNTLADTSHEQRWHQNRPGIKGGAEAYDYFGAALP